MSPTVTFDEADHSLDLLNRLYKMRMEERYCDFIIKVGSERIPAHRNVLTAVSDYFDRMLFHDTMENSSGTVDMKNVDPDCVRLCVDFMYGREVDVTEDKYEDLMHVANLMQLNKLVKIVENIIVNDLCLTLFFIAKRIADRYPCEILQSKCKEFANHYFASISMEDEFGDLDKSYVTEIIKSASLKMTEVEKLEAALRWVKHDMESRSKYAVHFLECVDLRFVPLQKRQQLLDNDPLIKENMASVRILIPSVIESLKVEAERKSAKEKAIIVFDRKTGLLQQFKPRSNSWRQLHQMNDVMKMKEFSALVYGDYIYLFMKNKEVTRLKYTDETATWEQMAEMLEKHGCSPSVVAVGGWFYVIGDVNYCASKCVERFDPEINEWIKLQDKPQATTGSTILVMRGCIFSFGGCDSNLHLMSNVQRFDPATSEWKEMKPMREAKYWMAAVEFNNQAYVMGGYNEDSLASVDCYDPEMDQWTSVTPMRSKRYYFRAFAMDSSIYAVGGFQHSIEKYDAEKNEWTMVQMPSGMRLVFLESVEIKLER